MQIQRTFHVDAPSTDPNLDHSLVAKLGSVEGWYYGDKAA